MTSRGVAALAASAVVFVLALAGTGGAGGAPANVGKLDLPTVAAIDAYLRSRGLDPATFVKQFGLLNYAGPECPGLGWNCTRSPRVVQVAAAGGTNKSDCRPQEDVLYSTATSCVIVQDTVSGQNHASCKLRISDVTPAVLSCDITQDNVDGGNHALVQETIDQRRGADQDATDSAFVRQFTVTGQNHAQASQDINQFTSAEAAQTQDGLFDTSIDQQVLASGENHCHLTQSLNQDGRMTGAASQTQNGTQEGDVFQAIGEVGEGITATAVGGSGSSHCEAHQQERKNLVGNGTQTQFGPQSCCATQIGDGNVHIHQDSFATASQPNAVQELDTTGRFSPSSDGLIVHHLKIEEDAVTAHDSDGFLHSHCSGGVEGFCFSEDEEEPSTLDVFFHGVTAHPW